MRRNSLAFRLIAAASIWAVVALLAAGFILTSLYRQTVVRGFDQRLQVYLQSLAGGLAEQPPANLQDPGNLGEQLFELPYSGWYWQVRRADGGPVVVASKSLFNDLLDMTKARDVTTVDGVTNATLTGPDDQQLRVVNRTIEFGPGNSYDVLVAGDAGEMEIDIDAFRWNVFLTLAAFGVGLVLATTAQIRFGLRPLDRVRSGLADLRSGKEARFEGPFPAEIEPLAKELNALLLSNQEVIDRARTQVGNLAHALKTPLSVITNEARAAKGPLADKVTEQAELMRTQVGHYLDRARIAARANVIGAVTEVKPVISSLVRAMSRIHEDRGLALSASIPDDALFKGEKQDLEEIVGNLVDNACKWAKSEVSISAEYRRPVDDEATGRLALRIDDDGPGLTLAEQKEATQRGRRLDETKPGSGLGLSIVTDLVGLYGGKFRLDRAPIGGVRAEIELPAA